MAAFIGWIDANVGSTPQKRGEPGVAAGGLVREFAQSWTKKTTDGDGSIYFITQIPSDAILVDMKFNMDAISGLTAQSFGVFKVDASLANLGGANQTAATYYAGANATSGTNSGGNVDAKAILMASTDTHSGYAVGSELSAMSAVTTQTITTLGATAGGFLNSSLKLWQLLGFTDPKWKDDSYMIGSYLGTAGSAAGNMFLCGRYIQG